MKTILIVLAVALTSFGVYYISSQSDSTPNIRGTSYDMYVFALQWGKTMCVGGDSSCNSKLSAIPKNEVSIHGLWPSLKSGAKMSDCNSGSSISVKSDGSSVFNSMKTYWPSLNSNTNEKFWTHEFNKHGYCYSKDYKTYFQKAMDVFKGKNLHRLILNAVGSQSGNYSISVSDLKTKLNNVLGGKYYGLVCKSSGGKKYLSEIRITMDTNFSYIKSTLSDSCSGTILIPFR